MLQNLLRTRKDEVLARFQKRAYLWSATPEVRAELTQQVSLFVEQLVRLLGLEPSAPDNARCCDEISSSAAKHGQSLLQYGFPLAQAVNDYGDVCRVISEVAAEQDAPLSEADVARLSLGSVSAIVAAAGEYRSRGSAMPS